jgi:hypothetical protein
MFTCVISHPSGGGRYAPAGKYGAYIARFSYTAAGSPSSGRPSVSTRAERSSAGAGVAREYAASASSAEKPAASMSVRSAVARVRVSGARRAGEACVGSAL